MSSFFEEWELANPEGKQPIQPRPDVRRWNLAVTLRTRPPGHDLPRRWEDEAVHFRERDGRMRTPGPATTCHDAGRRP